MRRIVTTLLALIVVSAAVPACSREGKASAETPGGLYREAAITAPPEKEVGAPAQASLAPLIKRLRPAVVNISTTTVVKHPARGQGQRGSPEEEFFERFFGVPAPDAPQQFRGSSLGSGFIINAEGYILTNNHVVKDATDIRVKLTDNREFAATVVGKDAVTDMALIRLKNPPKDLPTVVLGDSDALEQGDFVLALGSPFGLADTATFGIISAKHRSVNGGTYDDFLQTDAAINPGNSGGPLFNLRGEVVGINTMILAPQGTFVGVGFAVPITLAKTVLPQLKEKGKVVRGYLGVQVSELTPDLAQGFGFRPEQKGALVQQVVKGTPAEKAGLEAGDLVVAMNGKPIESSSALTRGVATIPPGEKVNLTFVRKGAEKKATLVVAKRPDEGALARGDFSGDESEEQGAGGEGEKSKVKLGITVQPITPELARRLDSAPGEGLVVVDVDEDGPAARAGVRPGDVILEVNRARVKSPADVSKALSSLKDGDMALLRVKRGGGAVFVAVPVGGRK
ncbi:MAG TPA: DegQ family serine endoprotease [Anaeromyxobacteraceae bacterium]|nr:DegQ family serine endoprotease [Anaeromyxobacteraceae bacterium]